MPARVTWFDQTKRAEAMLREETAQAVCAALADIGATFEYPGYISVPHREGRGTFHFGTANATWGGEFVDWKEDYLDAYVLDIDRNSLDVNAIVAAIRAAIEGVS